MISVMLSEVIGHRSAESNDVFAGSVPLCNERGHQVADGTALTVAMAVSTSKISRAT